LSEKNWTKEQSDAINARGGTLLLSAAAGSGKTAVLTERAVKKLTDADNPVPPERLLIVTFTNAAAGEMKQKIYSALSALIKGNPGNARISKIRASLYKANIMTVDKFLINLLRENFYGLSIEPDFAIVSGADLDIMAEKAMRLTLEDMYSSQGENFAELSGLLIKGRDDKPLAEAIRALSRYSRSYPFPEIWLDEAENMYKSEEPAEKTGWGRVIIDYATGALEYAGRCVSKALEIIEGDPDFKKSYGDAFLSDGVFIKEFLRLLETGDWDAMREKSAKYPALRLSGVRGVDINKKEYLQFLREQAKTAIKELPSIFCASRAEHEGDMKALSGAVSALAGAVKLFEKNLSELKKEENVLEFGDTLHLAIRLLCENNENILAKSPKALELQENFDEILVDEYQDTNEAQDILYKLLSKDEGNIFMVGDVKQSIYAFRLANPKLFVSKIESFSLFDTGRFPAKIFLNRNFRSKKGILDAVNFVFSGLMSKKLGDIAYSDDEKLFCGLAENENSEDGKPCAEFHVLEPEFKTNIDERTLYEAEYIADIISENVKSGRDYGDFCVLMRNNARADIYAGAFERGGIPCEAAAGGSFFEAPEISAFTAFLKIIDNPTRDVEMLTALMSPVYGFTTDEIAEIRAESRQGSVYASLVKSADNGFAKARDFLGELKNYRLKAAVMDVYTLIEALYYETGYFPAVMAMKNPNSRKSNLNLLLNYAEAYTANSTMGLPGFIRYIDSLEAAGGGLPSAKPARESSGAVKLMTMHKSKGLEFPVVILAGCGSEFNRSDRRGTMIIHPEAGIGFMRQELSELKRYTTLPYSASKIAIEKSGKSEELRVLYVAMTRAKEKLIMPVVFGNAEKELKYFSNIARGGIEPFAALKQSSFAGWLTSAFIRHPGASALREYVDFNPPEPIKADFNMKFVYGKLREKDGIQDEAACKTEPDADIMQTINERASYTYPYEALSCVLAKRTASDLSEAGISFEYFASKRPSFMSAGGLSPGRLSPSERGNACHLFMQLCDFEKAARDTETEGKRLLAEGKLTAAQENALDYGKIAAFFGSETGKSVFAADEVYREKKFAFLLPAGRVYPGLPPRFNDENILLQGMIDLFCVKDGKVLIVDYKTDRAVSAGELAERYRNQLTVYKLAVKEVFGIDAAAVIYSFALEREIYI